MLGKDGCVLSVECTVRRFFSSYRPNWPIIPQLGSRPCIEPQTRPLSRRAFNREYEPLARSPSEYEIWGFQRLFPPRPNRAKRERLQDSSVIVIDGIGGWRVHQRHEFWLPPHGDYRAVHQNPLVAVLMRDVGAEDDEVKEGEY